MTTAADLSKSRVVIVVIGMKGCGACEEYIPRFQRIATRYAHCLPVRVLDASTPEGAQVAARFRVEATPTTLILRKPHGQVHYEGARDDAEIEGVFALAARGLSCELE